MSTVSSSGDDETQTDTGGDMTSSMRGSITGALDHSTDFLSELQIDAVQTCTNLQRKVSEVHISEILPHTHELVFLNVTTHNGGVYCLERTEKGWRACSLQHDSMQGELRHLDLHVEYFPTAEALLPWLEEIALTEGESEATKKCQ